MLARFPASIFKEAQTRSKKLPLHSFLEKHSFFIPPRLDVLPAVSLAAMKLLAVQNRDEGKDHYDLYRLLSLQRFSKTADLAQARIYSHSLFDFTRFDERFLEKAAESVKRADVRVLASTDAYILKGSRPDWAALKKDLVRLIQTNLA